MNQIFESILILHKVDFEEYENRFQNLPEKVMILPFIIMSWQFADLMDIKQLDI